MAYKLKEKLHTIPVNDAFDEDSECPLCAMVESLEENAIDFTMGQSYMEDDVRGETSRLGFCSKHAKRLYGHQNRLGLALIIQTHMKKVIKEVEKSGGIVSKVTKPSLFKKEKTTREASYISKVQSSCYICEKVDGTFDRYVDTLFHLYRREDEFRKKFNSCKGFCTNHYQLLSEQASRSLSGSLQDDFIKKLNSLYIDNMKRVVDDLEWFIDKFDYRYKDEPWGDSKDALQRALRKMNSINLE